MKLTDFNPYVRYAAKIAGPRPYPELICAYDHRLFYVASGGFSIEFSDQTIPLSAGDVITIPPATAYRLAFCEACHLPDSRFATGRPATVHGTAVETEPEEILYYIINFDFDNFAYGTEAHTPQPPAHFDAGEIFSTASFEPFTSVFLLHHGEMLAPVIDEIYTEVLKASLQSPHISSALMKYALSKAVNLSEKHIPAGQTKKLISDIKQFIQKNICNTVTNNSVAEHFDYHPYYLNSLFLKYEGVTLHKYITETKLRKARELLLSTNQAVYEIAAACGFQGASYFSETFLKHHGITPTQYRERSK